MPSPVLAETIRICKCGLTRSAWPMQAPTSKSRCGSRSVLFSSIRSAAANMSGYLSGLSSPSVTDSTHDLVRLAEIERRRGRPDCRHSR